MNEEDDCAVMVADENGRIANRVARGLNGVLAVRSLSDGAKLKSTMFDKKSAKDALQV